MQEYLSERGIAIVTMSSPTARAQVHFDVTGMRAILPELHHGPAKIRPAFNIVKSRVKNTNGHSVQSLKLIAKQSLVLPNRLEQPLGRRDSVLMQERHHAALHAPLSVKIIEHSQHQILLCAQHAAKSSLIAGRGN